MLFILMLALISLAVAFAAIGVLLLFFACYVKFLMYKNEITWSAAFRLICSNLPMNEWPPIP